MKKLLIFLLASMTTMKLLAQSEPVNSLSYDTLIQVIDAQTNAALGSLTWKCRVIRRPDYFTAGVSLPALMFMPGAGEVQTGAASDSAFFSRYGPDFWLQHGWDGGIQLGNGKHYPLIIIPLQVAANMRPWYTLGLLRSVIQVFHPRSIHLSGVSQGAYEWGEGILYSNNITGDEEFMSKISSYTDLQGVGPGDNFNGISWAYPTGFGHWAKKYGGKIWGIEGTTDSRNVWQITGSANDSTAGKNGYFAWSNYGGGGHGASDYDGISWNWNFDPAMTNWTSVPPTLTGLTTGSPSNTMGTFVNPESLMQWMLRQGDTTLVGGSGGGGGGSSTTATPIATNKWFLGEYVELTTNAIGKPFTITDNPKLAGTGGGGIICGLNAWAWPGTSFVFTGVGHLHGSLLVDTFFHAFAAGGNDQGQNGNGVISPNETLTPTQITTDSSGAAFNNIKMVAAGFLSNVAQCYYFYKGDNTLWMTGDTRFGARGDGWTGDTASRPVKVGQIPGGRIIKYLIAGKYTIAVATDMTIWSTGNGVNGAPGQYPYLGYVPTNSAINFLSWHQVNVTLNAGDSIVGIAGGDVGGTIFWTKQNKMYGFGQRSTYLGNAQGIPYTVPQDLQDSITKFITRNGLYGIRKVVTNSNCWHAINTNGELFGWGDDAMGCVGDGQSLAASSGYSVDPSIVEGLMVIHPVQITTLSNFIDVFGSPLFSFLTIAITADGRVLSWGRNKGGVLGNGVDGCSSDIRANYGNSWDKTTPIVIRPDTILAPIIMPSPFCILNPGGSACTDAGCTIVHRTISASAGPNQNISAASTSLTALGSSVINGRVTGYRWIQTSGPSQAIFDITAASTPLVTGLANGTYVFRVTITDDMFDSAFASVTINVGNIPPTVTVGGSQTITLPTNSVSLTATAVANGGATMSTTVWSQSGGPSISTLTNANTLNATASNLIQGTYTFLFTATDSNGSQSVGTIAITVLPATSYFLKFNQPTKLR